MQNQDRDCSKMVLPQLQFCCQETGVPHLRITGGYHMETCTVTCNKWKGWHRFCSVKDKFLLCLNMLHINYSRPGSQRSNHHQLISRVDPNCCLVSLDHYSTGIGSFRDICNLNPKSKAGPSEDKEKILNKSRGYEFGPTIQVLTKVNKS